MLILNFHRYVKKYKQFGRHILKRLLLLKRPSSLIKMTRN